MARLLATNQEILPPTLSVFDQNLTFSISFLYITSPDYPGTRELIKKSLLLMVFHALALLREENAIFFKLTSG